MAAAGQGPLSLPGMQWKENIWSDLKIVGIPTEPIIMEDRIKANCAVSQNPTWVVVLLE